MNDMADHGLHIFTDGCFSPVSRRGGWAFVVYRDGLETASGLGGAENTSNNAMEIAALLRALIWINSNVTRERPVVWSDSVYAVTGCRDWLPIWKINGWKKIDPNPNTRRRIISNVEIWKEIDTHLHRIPPIEILWCKGHSSIPGNERADELAGQGCRSGPYRAPC
jgi:ribonuclease HI